MTNKYQIKFYGRERNAIGAFYNITAEIQGISEDDAIARLGETYEYNYIIKCNIIQDGVIY